MEPRYIETGRQIGRDGVSGGSRIARSRAKKRNYEGIVESKLRMKAGSSWQELLGYFRARGATDRSGVVGATVFQALKKQNVVMNRIERISDKEKRSGNTGQSRVASNSVREKLRRIVKNSMAQKMRVISGRVRKGTEKENGNQA